MSERSVGEDRGESIDCVINDLHLPECVSLKGSRGVIAIGLEVRNAVAIQYLPVGRYTTGT